MNKQDKARGAISLIIIAAALIAAFLVNSFAIINANIIDKSMEPTIMDGSMVIAGRLSYLYTSPKKGDVILFLKEEAGAGLIIKRVEATFGDKVKTATGEELIVPKDCYFVTGDNKKKSVDSRHWGSPFVKREDIKARALFVYFPKLEIIK